MTPEPSTDTSPLSIEACVRQNLETYFEDIDGLEPSNMHHMLMRLVEKPLLQMVMERTNHNQSRAAQWLGLNRNTLHKKLLEHQLIEQKISPKTNAKKTPKANSKINSKIGKKITVAKNKPR